MDSSTSSTGSETASPKMANTSQPTAVNYPPQHDHDHSSGSSTPTTAPSLTSPDIKSKNVVNPLVTAVPSESTLFGASLVAPPVSTVIQHPALPVDPLRREYPKPTAEINVAEALAREPLPRTLGHWRKNSKDIVPKVETEEIKRQKFEEMKAKLLQEQAELNEEQGRK